MRAFIITAILLLSVAAIEAEDIRVNNNKFVFPFSEKSKEALLEINRQNHGNMIPYFTALGVKFNGSASIKINEIHNLLIVICDHESGIRVMQIMSLIAEQSFNMTVYGFEDPLNSPEVDLSGIKNPVVKKPRKKTNRQ
ncbi:hypothetical protein NT6N_33110 [Oceaniferula spumae]|uniref:DUF4252 domain-containing protein n=1 Tax=Oceaniferula spumae TaxID=2979115 RepID=A0AAT9FQJ8_9BACT